VFLYKLHSSVITSLCIFSLLSPPHYVSLSTFLHLQMNLCFIAFTVQTAFSRSLRDFLKVFGMSCLERSFVYPPVTSRSLTRRQKPPLILDGSIRENNYENLLLAHNIFPVSPVFCYSATGNFLCSVLLMKDCFTFCISYVLRPSSEEIFSSTHFSCQYKWIFMLNWSQWNRSL
jgi:hypothetical protein